MQLFLFIPMNTIFNDVANSYKTHKQLKYLLIFFFHKQKNF